MLTISGAPARQAAGSWENWATMLLNAQFYLWALDVQKSGDAVEGASPLFVATNGLSSLAGPRLFFLLLFLFCLAGV